MPEGGSMSGETMIADILARQKAWLDKLQEISPKPILIKAKEGKIQNGDNPSLYLWIHYKDVWGDLKEPIYTRGILQNEILLDPDTKEWNHLVIGMNQIKAFCAKEGIPLYLAYSGGNGVHGDIFFDTKSLMIDEDNFNNAKKYDIDLFKTARKVLTDIVFAESGANRLSLAIDSKKINFSKDRMGSQVREYGTMRPDGNYKTLITTIPETRPCIGSLPLIFPEKIELWKVSDKYNRLINDNIRAELKKAEEYKDYNLETIDLSGSTIEKFPCIKTLFKTGASAGKRYYGSNSIVLMAKKCGYSWTATKELIEKFFSKCDITQSEAQLRIENNKPLFGAIDYHFSCRAIKEVFGDEICNFSGCVLRKKLRAAGKKIKTEKEGDAELSAAMGVYKNNMQLAEEVQKIAPIYYDESRNFWLWKKQEQYYKRIDETDILSNIEAASGEYVIENSTKNEIIDGIKITGRRREVKLIEKTWIHTAEAVIDYKTNERFNPKPTHFFTSPIPHKIGSSEDTPIIDKLFKDWMGDNTTILYEICAYCLIDDYPIHRMFLLFGRGRNGKSQFLKLLTNFIGTKNTTSTELEKVIESRFEASKLYRKKVALVGETDFTAIKSTDRLKKITGDDMITAEFKHKDPFDFENTAKIIIATNNLPESLDKTDGFYSRCIILEFKNQFDEGKSIVDMIPEGEYENLLNKCLKILPGLLERGRFTNEGTIEEKEQKYEKLSNPFPTFKEKELIDDADAETPVWVLRDMYEAFCRKNGFRKIGEREFTQLLNKEGYETKRIYFGVKKWNAVFGLAPKTPYVYDITEGNNEGENRPDRPDRPDSTKSSPYGEKVKTSGLSGLSGLKQPQLNTLTYPGTEPDQQPTIAHIRDELITQSKHFPEGINEHLVAAQAYRWDGATEERIIAAITHLIERGDIQTIGQNDKGIRRIKWVGA